MNNGRLGPSHSTAGRAEFTLRTLIAVGVVTLAGTIAAVFVTASDLFFLFFAAVLLAILLRGTSDALGRRVGLSPRWAFALVLVGLAGVFAAGAYFAGSMAAAQLEQLSADLPKSIDQARAELGRREWGRQLLDRLPPADRLLSGRPGNAASHAVAFFSATFGVLGNLVVLAFLALYLAADPRSYVNGFVVLVPPARRPRAERVLAAVGGHLKGWLLGRLAAMAAVGVVTGVGLWAVGVPQFLVLAGVAALLSAVPYVGPILGAVPGVLVALLQGPSAALWAVAVYTLAQAVENYLVTPLVQQDMADLPPAVAIAAVATAGGLFGAFGLVVAAPLAVAVLVAVKTLYVEDVLGDDAGVSGAEPPGGPPGPRPVVV